MDIGLDLDIVKTEEDVMKMLDNLLEKRDSEWWDKFYTRDESSVPFFKNIPDENLVSYVERGILNGGDALDIGWGKGRNSMYLGQRGFKVLGIDFSNTSIELAKEFAQDQDIKVKFICQSIFDHANDKKYDFVYDGGCFHHIKPHRRNKYFQIIYNSMKEDGYFAMTCFNLKGGANISDYDVYRDKSMSGGMGFSEYKLKNILQQYFEIIEFREMKKVEGGEYFGEAFLWTVLMKKKIN